MAKDSDSPTPIPVHVQRSIAGRVEELEKGQGRLLGEVGVLGEWRTGAERRLQAVEVVVSASDGFSDDDEERTSQADLSLRPTRARASLKGLPPWVVASVFLAAILATAIVLIVWLARKNS